MGCLGAGAALFSPGQFGQHPASDGQHAVRQQGQSQDGQQPGHAGSTGRSLARDGAALARLAQEHDQQGDRGPQGEGVEPGTEFA
jgi:hypothetical protein